MEFREIFTFSNPIPKRERIRIFNKKSKVLIGIIFGVVSIQAFLDTFTPINYENFPALSYSSLLLVPLFIGVFESISDYRKKQREERERKALSNFRCDLYKVKEFASTIEDNFDFYTTSNRKNKDFDKTLFANNSSIWDNVLPNLVSRHYNSNPRKNKVTHEGLAIYKYDFDLESDSFVRRNGIEGEYFGMDFQIYDENTFGVVIDLKEMKKWLKLKDIVSYL